MKEELGYCVICGREALYPDCLKCLRHANNKQIIIAKEKGYL